MYGVSKGSINAVNEIFLMSDFFNALWGGGLKTTGRKKFLESSLRKEEAQYGTTK